MIYFAHRGASAHRVQNTLPAFALAYSQGARCFELDVHLLKDGQLAVHHDYSLLSTAGVEVNLADLTAQDLLHYPLHNSFSNEEVYVPLLGQVLSVVAPGLQCLNIEIKNEGNLYPGVEEKLVQLLLPFAGLMPKILFSSFEEDSLVRLRALLPAARLGWLTRSFRLERALELGVESVHISQTRFSKQMLEACHARGIKVYVYTVNDPAAARQLAREGVDGIFTDYIHFFI